MTCYMVITFYHFVYFFFFFFNDTATTEIYTLSLHDALPIFVENQPANLGAEQVVVTFVFGQHPAEPDLRQAGAIERRGVKIARSLLPGRIHGGSSFLVGEVTKHVAERRSAEAERAV